jgi:hypothetical protein
MMNGAYGWLAGRALTPRHPVLSYISSESCQEPLHACIIFWSNSACRLAGYHPSNVAQNPRYKGVGLLAGFNGII